MRRIPSTYRLQSYNKGESKPIITVYSNPAKIQYTWRLLYVQYLLKYLLGSREVQQSVGGSNSQIRCPTGGVLEFFSFFTLGGKVGFLDCRAIVPLFHPVSPLRTTCLWWLVDYTQKKNSQPQAWSGFVQLCASFACEAVGFFRDTSHHCPTLNVAWDQVCPDISLPCIYIQPYMYPTDRCASCVIDLFL